MQCVILLICRRFWTPCRGCRRTQGGETGEALWEGRVKMKPRSSSQATEEPEEQACCARATCKQSFVSGKWAPSLSAIRTQPTCAMQISSTRVVGMKDKRVLRKATQIAAMTV